MTQYIKPFQAHNGATFYVANAVVASAPALLDQDTDTVALYNSSTTAVAYWRCVGLSLATDPGASAVVPTAAQTPAVGDIPIPPGAILRLSVGSGWKRFSVIASAADGNLFITPGTGN